VKLGAAGFRVDVPISFHTSLVKTGRIPLEHLKGYLERLGRFFEDYLHESFKKAKGEDFDLRPSSDGSVMQNRPMDTV